MNAAKHFYVIVGATCWCLPVFAQQTSTPISARETALVDLTGTWVSVVTEDWAWRMQTPRKGDYASLPLNAAGRRTADQWNEADDGSCLAFGAAAMLRVPTRARIAWDDAETLRIETDNGEQTRRLHFHGDVGAWRAPSLQGYSIARWQPAATGGSATSDGTPPWASLEVITTDMQAAWLRPNGVPYTADALMTEYFDRFSDGEDVWFTVTTIIEDPTYLTEPLVISSNFKREPDGSRWSPRPCIQ